jgi:hypothetical protein
MVVLGVAVALHIHPMRMLQIKTVTSERIRRLIKVEERLAFDSKRTDLETVLRWIKKATEPQRSLARNHL